MTYGPDRDGVAPLTEGNGEWEWGQVLEDFPGRYQIDSRENET
jgi:hypothetical protein